MDLLNMLAYLSANQDRVVAAVVAFTTIPTEEDPEPKVQMATLGKDTIIIFGLSELVKLQLYKDLSEAQNAD
jgi:hypothetical protein